MQTETESAGQSENVNVSDTENVELSETQGNKGLVAYFSATGTTEGVTEHIANGLNADIYEIIPEEPCTDADLNYNDNNSRSNIEMNDPSFRPAISGSVENMILCLSDILSGRERRRELSAPLWKAMIFPDGN